MLEQGAWKELINDELVIILQKKIDAAGNIEWLIKLTIAQYFENKYCIGSGCSLIKRLYEEWDEVYKILAEKSPRYFKIISDEEIKRRMFLPPPGRNEGLK